jgi:hypothetical protein
MEGHGCSGGLYKISEARKERKQKKESRSNSSQCPGSVVGVEMPCSREKMGIRPQLWKLYH